MFIVNFSINKYGINHKSIMGDLKKIEKKFIFPGTSSEKIDNYIENDRFKRRLLRKNIHIHNTYTSYYCKKKMKT
jgi:hypothetical protein